MRAFTLHASVASALAAVFIVASTPHPQARTAGYRNLRDFDGDGKTDLAVVNYVNGAAIWHVRRSSDGGLTSTQWGSTSDRFIAADFDGDGRADHAVVRYTLNSMLWFIRRSSDGGLSAYTWGLGPNSDRVIWGDFDGDGKTDIGVYRYVTSTFYIRRSSDGVLMTQPWGKAGGEETVTGDFDGDGRSDFGVRGYSRTDPFSTAYFFYLLQSTAGFTAINWGRSGVGESDSVVEDGDFDGDGKQDVAIVRRYNGDPGMDWYIRPSSTGGLQSERWGTGGGFDVPVPGDYDGDGKSDIAVYRYSESGPEYFYIHRSSDGGLTAIQWGFFADIVANCHAFNVC